MDENQKKRVMMVFVVCLVGLMVAGVAAWISGYGNEVKVDPTASAIYELENRIGLVAGEAQRLGERTGALETRTSDLEATVKALPDKLAEQFGEKLAEKADRAELDKKADRAAMARKADKSDLDKKADNGRVDMLEAQVVAIKEPTMPSTTVAQTRTAGTVTVRVRTVPVEPDEE